MSINLDTINLLTVPAGGESAIRFPTDDEIVEEMAKAMARADGWQDHDGLWRAHVQAARRQWEAHKVLGRLAGLRG